MQEDKIYFLRKAFIKMRYFVSLCEDEISGLGKVEEINGKLVVTDVEIFKQVVSGAHSNLDDDALAEFLFEQTKKGEDLAKWRLWWHSHARMQVFFSKTDTDTIDASTEYPWLISVVSNHAGDIKARYDIYKPYRMNKDLGVEILEDEDDELKELCQKEIDEKVSKQRDFYPRYQRQEFKNNQNPNKKKRNLFWEDDDQEDLARGYLGK